MPRNNSKSNLKKENKQKIANLTDLANSLAIVNIFSTRNNLMINVANEKGEVKIFESSGSCGFNGSKRRSVYAAETVVRKVIDRMKEFSIFNISLRSRGIGSGRIPALKRLFYNPDLIIHELVDRTGLDHGIRRDGKKQRRLRKAQRK